MHSARGLCKSSRTTPKTSLSIGCAELQQVTCTSRQSALHPARAKQLNLNHCLVHHSNLQPRFQVLHTAHQHRNLSTSSFPSWTSNGSITARNKKERLSWRLSEITDPSPSLPSAEQQASLQILQTPHLQQPFINSTPEDLSLQIGTTAAEAAQQTPTEVTADLASTLLDATAQPQAPSSHQPLTPPDTSIMYTEEMLGASQPAPQLNPDISNSETTSPMPTLSSLPQLTISTKESTISTPPPPPISLPLPGTDITTSQALPSLVLTQMPGYGPEQQSFLVTPSASGFSVPSTPSLLENGLASNELNLSYAPVEQLQQQLTLQAAYDPQAEVKMVHRVPPPTEKQPKPDPVFWGGFLNKCRLAYDVFFPPKPVPRVQLSGKEVVMSRLQMVLVADRCVPELVQACVSVGGCISVRFFHGHSAIFWPFPTDSRIISRISRKTFDCF